MVFSNTSTQKLYIYIYILLLYYYIIIIILYYFAVDSHKMKDNHSALKFLQTLPNLSSYETVYIHMKTKELASGKGPNSVSLKFQEIMTTIRQKATSVRICVSTCIPRHQSQTSKIDKEILQYNESLRDLINTLSRKNGDSILISENELLQRFLAHSSNNRDLIQLTEHGGYEVCAIQSI